MRDSGFNTKDEEQEWRELVYLEAIRNDSIRRQAFIDAQGMREEHDPPVTQADLEMAKRYLYVCCMKKSIKVLKEATDRELAALWAWGTLGAAKHRAGRRRGAEGLGRRRATGSSD